MVGRDNPRFPLDIALLERLFEGMCLEQLPKRGNLLEVLGRDRHNLSRLGQRPEQTEARGLIDLDRPKDSKILRLIQMGAGETAGTALIHEKTRRAEYKAFAAWIEAAAADPKLRDAPKLAAEQLAHPSRPDKVIRHARTDRLLESFERNVWAWRFRCMNCHTEGTPQNDKLRAKHGDRVAWVKRDGAEATMRYLLGSALIDAKAPEKSLLLLKPLGEVEHGGGKKFLPGDQGYKGFRAWLEDYSAIVGGRYLVKVYVDAGGRIAADWKATLGENDSVGEVEVTSAWPEGNGKMTVVAAGRVQK